MSLLKLDRASKPLCPKPGALLLAITFLLLALSGCATSRRAENAGQTMPATNTRRFDFQKDAFSFANELVWIYEYDANGKWTTRRRHPRPSYTQHCFVLARSTRQFFLNARFDSGLPIASDAVYRDLIRRVVSSSPRHALPQTEKIIIPGYPDLRSFSLAHERLLKSECGGGWQSYVQRGHWRMIFPFSRSHQQNTADKLFRDLQSGEPLVAHIVCFPQLTINHAVVLFAATRNEKQIQFSTYDPNRPSDPILLTYDCPTRTFLFEANNYFPGGRIDVYQVYYKWDY